MAVPKKKKAKSQTRAKHSTFMAWTRKRMIDELCLVACTHCTSMKKNHTICWECWYYNWKEILAKKKWKTATVVHV